MPEVPGFQSVIRIFKPEDVPDDFEELLAAGNEFWMRRNYKKALKYFDLAIEVEPIDERPWNNKGIVLRNMGRIEEARTCFEEAALLKPNNAVIKRNLKTLDKPITSSSSLYSFGTADSTVRIIPILKYEIPQIMVTATVVASAILFVTLFLMFRSSQSLWQENFHFLTLALTAVSFTIIIISLISQLHYLIPIVEYEIRMFLIFLLGVVFIMMVPIHESLGYAATKELWSLGNILLFLLGSFVVTIAITLFYIKGGYFLPWLLGVIIFMTTAFHESFNFVVFTDTFGIFDQATAVIGIIIIMIGLILFILRKVVNTLLIRSENLRSEGKLDDAMRILNRILKFNPYNEVAWNDKGNVLFDKGDFKSALDCYSKALDLDSRYDIANQNLTLCKQKLSIS
jgi:hypothetical protein